MYIIGNKDTVDFFIQQKIKNKKIIKFDKASFDLNLFVKQLKQNDLFGTEKTILLDNVDLDKKNTEIVSEYLSKNTDVCVYVKKYGTAKKDNLYKLYEKNKHLINFDEIVDFFGRVNKSALGHLKQLITDYTKENNIGVNNIDFLLEKSNYNIQITINYLKQLSLISKDINEDLINEFLVSNKIITNFDLVDSLINKDYFLYISNLDKLFVNPNINSLLESLLYKFKTMSLIYYFGVSNSTIDSNEISFYLNNAIQEFKDTFELNTEYNAPKPYTMKLTIEKIVSFPLGHITNMYIKLYDIYEQYRFGDITEKDVYSKLNYFYFDYVGQ